MALIKVNNDFGIELNYWRIESISLDNISDTAMINIGLYADKEAVNAIKYETISLYNEDFRKYFSRENIIKYNDIYNSAYLAVKEKCEYFLTAEDDEEERKRRISKR